MTDDVERIMALALAYAKEFALIKVPTGELYRNVAIDRAGNAGAALRAEVERLCAEIVRLRNKVNEMIEAEYVRENDPNS